MYFKLPEIVNDIDPGFTGQKIVNELSENMHKILTDKFTDYLQRNPIIMLEDLKEQGMPNISLRITTLHQLFDGFRDVMEDCLHDDFQSKYKEFLSKIGTRIGLSYAMDLIYCWCYKKNKIPIKYQGMLHSWAAFDSATDMAKKIVVNVSDSGESEFSVVIEDSFLLVGRNVIDHVHCAFMEGYILGTIDGLSLLWTDWKFDIGRRQGFGPPDCKWRVASVNETDTGKFVNKCYFKVKLFQDEDPDRRVSSILSKAVTQSWDNTFNGSVAIEVIKEAIRCGMELPKGAPFQWMQFFKVAKDKGFAPSVSTEKLIEKYNLGNDSTHGGEIVQNSNQQLLIDIWMLCREIPYKFAPEFQKAMIADQARWV